MLSAFRGAPRGPWGAVLHTLASPWTAWFILVWLGAQMLLGLEAEPGQHPAYGVLVRLPSVLLPFCLLARWSISDRTQNKVSYLGCGLGLIVALAGAALAGSAGGYATLGAARPTETFTKVQAGHTVPVHLGGQVKVLLDDGTMGLSLSAGKNEIAKGTIAARDAAESRLGPWSIYLKEIRTGLEPVYADLALTPRESGDAIKRRVRVGTAVTLPDNTELSVLRLTGDFLGTLGPAAQLQLAWAGGGDTSWYFVESPDLDSRTGISPWRITVVGLASEPRMTFGVRRAGSVWLAASGWLLVGFSLFGFLGPRREE